MNLIQTLIQMGARELVAVIAAEPAAAKAWPFGVRGRSPLSRGIAQIRRAFPELTAGRAGYDAARQVFRQQVRRAVEAREAMNRPEPPPSPSSPPRPPRSPRSRPPERTYTLRVEITSQRGARSTWTVVQVHGPEGMPFSQLRTLAERAVDDFVTAGTNSGQLVSSLGERRRIGQVQWIG